MTEVRLKKGDFIRLPGELKSQARTNFDFAKIERISGDGQIVDVMLVDENDVDLSRFANRKTRDYIFDFSL